MRDFTKKYFYLNSSAVYNSSAKKKNFFDEMIAESDEFVNSDKKSGDLHPHQDDNDDMEIVEVKHNTGYIFDPLTIEQCTTICHCTGLIYRKD